MKIALVVSTLWLSTSDVGRAEEWRIIDFSANTAVAIDRHSLRSIDRVTAFQIIAVNQTSLDDDGDYTLVDIEVDCNSGTLSHILWTGYFLDGRESYSFVPPGEIVNVVPGTMSETVFDAACHDRSINDLGYGSISEMVSAGRLLMRQVYDPGD